MATPKKLNRKRCGDFGGITAKGDPCPQPAGFGIRPKTDVGRCKDHSDEAEEQREEAMVAFLRHYLIGGPAGWTIERCAAQPDVDVAVNTIWMWREKYEWFDEAVNEAIERIDSMRNTMIEDSAYKQIIEGTAPAQLTIFWLKNRASHRWKDKVEVEQTNKDGETVVPLSLIRALTGGATKAEPEEPEILDEQHRKLLEAAPAEFEEATDDRG